MRSGLIAGSALIYFAFTLGALALLRKQGAVGTRTAVFLLFVIVCTVITRWTATTWHLFMGETAAAWVSALLAVALTYVLVLKSRRAAGTER